jgi:magnesium-protoporphyrin IX monomethyl ester (oxidative) cyclase
MLRHLQPPFGTGDVYADRFSPYFQRPELFGVSIEPVAAYRFVYPFDEAVVRRLAYHFEMRSEALDRIEDTVAAMRSEQRLWNAHQRESALYSHDVGSTTIVHDERWGWPRAVHEFTGAEAEVLRLCWRITSWKQIQAELRGTFSAPVVGEAIDTLQSHGILLREGAEFLSLPLRQPGWRRAPRPQELAQRTVVPYALQT